MLYKISNQEVNVTASYKLISPEIWATNLSRSKHVTPQGGKNYSTQEHWGLKRLPLLSYIFQ